MATTTIRLEDALKARIAAAAEQAGKSAHAFMLDAIADTVARAEDEQAFDRIAEQRWSTLVETGRSVAWDDAKTWLEARARGEQPPRPAARQRR